MPKPCGISAARGWRASGRSGPPARNLTPHATGLATWDYADFERAMIDGVRPDGTPLKVPMTFVMPYAKNMRPVERQALWAYLVSLEPVRNAIP